MTPTDTAIPTWSDVASVLTVLGVIGSGAIWALSTKFATRTQIATLHRKIEEERRQTDAAIGFHDKRVTECEQKQALAAQAATQVGNDIHDIKELLKGRLAENEKDIARHGERLAAIEGERRR